MKVLAFSDTHGDVDYLKGVHKKLLKENPDLIICAGDLLNFWKYSQEIKILLERFNKKVLLIHGNHENGNLIDRLCSKNIVNIHRRIFEFNNFNFVGYGGGGFEQSNKNLENYFEKIKNKLDNWIFITHAPPFNTNLDLINEYHVGSKSIRKIIEKFNPLLNICGHLHENFGIKDAVKKTKIINPGPAGEIINL